MGLDIYINKRIYVENWSHHSDEERVSVDIKVNGKKIPNLNINNVSYIICDFLYFRKTWGILEFFQDELDIESSGEFNIETLKEFKTFLEESIGNKLTNEYTKNIYNQTIGQLRTEIKVVELLEKKYLESDNPNKRNFSPIYEIMASW